MDSQVISELEKAGLDPKLEKRFLTVPVTVDEVTGKPKPVGKDVLLLNGEQPVPVALKSVSELFTGNKQPPSFASGPTKEYVNFFAMVEFTALEYLHAAGLERDEEFVRIYNLLRRRPDGTDANPLFSYLQAAARLYMSLFDISQAEYEAVFNRLTRSAKGQMEDAASTHYIRMLHDRLHQH
ncbi:MAG: hypothetical protein QM765_48115 [Myxococcales bacterium]